MPSHAMASFATEVSASQCEKKLIEAADTTPWDAAEAALSTVLLSTEGEDPIQMLLHADDRVISLGCQGHLPASSRSLL